MMRKIKAKMVADAEIMLSLWRKGNWAKAYSYKAKAKSFQGDYDCDHLLSHGNVL
jgi:hypothetical protein